MTENLGWYESQQKHWGYRELSGEGRLDGALLFRDGMCSLIFLWAASS